MFFWFIGTAVLSIGVIFRDPHFDYRLLIVGSVIPLGDGLFGGARVLHSVTVCAGLLAVLMLATGRGRPLRKLVLGLPIGMILHLVFDGIWNNSEVFWWPFFGFPFDDAELPVVEHGMWGIPLEGVGLMICVWLWWNNTFSDGASRRRFFRDGELDAVPARFG